MSVKYEPSSEPLQISGFGVCQWCRRAGGWWPWWSSPSGSGAPSTPLRSPTRAVLESRVRQHAAFQSGAPTNTRRFTDKTRQQAPFQGYGTPIRADSRIWCDVNARASADMCPFMDTNLKHAPFQSVLSADTRLFTDKARQHAPFRGQETPTPTVLQIWRTPPSSITIYFEKATMFEINGTGRLM